MQASTVTLKVAQPSHSSCIRHPKRHILKNMVEGAEVLRFAAHLLQGSQW